MSWTSTPSIGWALGAWAGATILSGSYGPGLILLTGACWAYRWTSPAAPLLMASMVGLMSLVLRLPVDATQEGFFLTTSKRNFPSSRTFQGYYLAHPLAEEAAILHLPYPQKGSCFVLERKESAMEAKALPLSGHWRDEGKDRWRKALQHNLGEGPAADLYASMATGETFDPTLRVLLGRFGMSHLLAFSGLHVSLLLGLLGGLLRLFRLYGKLVLAIQLIALLSCLVFIGPFPSALRAGGMATLMIVGRWIGRPSSALHALGLTTTILLIWEPNLSQHLGFQLSCGATAGILLWSRPTSLLLCSCMPRTGHPKWQTVQRWLGQWLAPNLAVLPLTVPVLLWRFHEFNLLGLWINALFAPLFSLGFMVSLFVPLLGPMLGGPLRWCTEGLLELLDLPWWWDWWTAPCPMHGTTAAIVTFCLAWSADRLFSSREIDC